MPLLDLLGLIETQGGIMKKSFIAGIAIVFSMAAWAVTENVRLDYELTVAGKKIPTKALEMPFGEEEIVEFQPQKVSMKEGVETINYLKIHPVEGYTADNSKIFLEMELGHRANGQTKVLMKPQIIAIDKSQAELSVGDQKELIRLKVSPSVAR